MAKPVTQDDSFARKVVALLALDWPPPPKVRSLIDALQRQKYSTRGAANHIVGFLDINAMSKPRVML